MKISIITPVFPTPAEAYRGAPIWNTLRELSGLADLYVYCTRPRYPFGLGQPASYRPRALRYSPEAIDTTTYNIPAHAIDYLAIPWLTRPFNGSTILRSLRRPIMRDRPDLILSYFVYPEGYAAVRLAKALGIPAVVGSRGSDLNKIRWNALVRRKVQFTLERASAILTVSKDLARVAQRLHARPEAIHTICNGVDARIFRLRDQLQARAELGLSPDHHLVVFVGWLSTSKGVAHLLEAISILNTARSQRWQVAFIGEGYLEAPLRRKARQLGMSGSSLFLGPLPSAQIATWMNACDICCLPSVSEGCPNVILEALSCGRPVVATSVGGVPELVDDSSGVLIPDNRPPTIADALQRAGNLHWDRQAIARRHQRSWAQVAKETYQICQDALIGQQACGSALERREPSYGACRS